VTPSQNRHINSLPTELLIIIFQNSCDLLYWPRSDPVLLSLVCRFWHAIVTACSVLWTSIIFDRAERATYVSATCEHRLRCRDWSNLDRTLTHAGTANINLGFHLTTKFYPNDEEERVQRLFGRCSSLSITLENDEYTFATSITMPHLEHLTLHIDENAHIESLLDSIEKRSPLFRSLSIIGFIPTDLARHKSLLRRIVRFDLSCVENDNIPFQGLQNLEELT
jgi:F-box-like